MAPSVLTAAIERLLVGEDLSRDEAGAALDEIMAGTAHDVQSAAFLVALRAKGESVEELVGLADAIRRHAVPVPVDPEGLVDTCGTGGGPATFNISTAAAFVAAGAGIRVAKHGNRAVTSRSGSADVLEALGATVELGPEAVARVIERSGVGFMFAPAYHPAFRHVVPVRRALGVRTAFNFLGPLANPAGARRQVVGVYDAASLERVARVLMHLGAEHALVVASRDGLDELSTGSVVDVAEVAGGDVVRSVIDPADLGFTPPPPGALAVDDANASAGVIREVLGGAQGPARDVVVLNAAAAIWVGGGAPSLADALSAATASIDSGEAGRRLAAFVDATREAE